MHGFNSIFDQILSLYDAFSTHIRSEQVSILHKRAYKNSKIGFFSSFFENVIGKTRMLKIKFLMYMLRSSSLLSVFIICRRTKCFMVKPPFAYGDAIPGAKVLHNFRPIYKRVGNHRRCCYGGFHCATMFLSASTYVFCMCMIIFLIFFPILIAYTGCKI